MEKIFNVCPTKKFSRRNFVILHLFLTFVLKSQEVKWNLLWNAGQKMK